MDTIRRICAVLVGLLLIFSSALKLIDPVGTSLIVEGYLKFLHMTWLNGFSIHIGYLLSLVEAIVGVGLVTGVWRKFFAVAAMSLIGFFTVISIVILIANPDMDCGCFSQAIHLTHAETFWKNIALCALCAVAFIPLKSLRQRKRSRKAAFFACSALLYALTLHGAIFHTPLLDFSPYRLSYTIVTEEKADPEEGYPSMTLFRENFDVPNWDDEYCPDIILHGKTAVISVLHDDPWLYYKCGDASLVETLYNRLAAAGFTPVILSNGCEQYRGAGAWEVAYADPSDLVSLNRSRVGVTLLSDGFIYRKFNGVLCPGLDELSSIAKEDPEEYYIESSSRQSLVFQGFVLVFAALLIFL